MTDSDARKWYGVFIQWASGGERVPKFYSCWQARANSVEEIRERARNERYTWFDFSPPITLAGRFGEIEIFDPETGALL